MKNGIAAQESCRDVRIPTRALQLDGELGIPEAASGIVLFAHGSGSSRHSPRNQYIARVIRQSGLATLLFDLLTPAEERIDAVTRHLRFDIQMLASRLSDAARWISREPEASNLRKGFFGASTGGAAALMCAAEFGDQIGAVVSRGGRPDLVGPALAKVISPTLLIVGELDDVVLSLNKQAYDGLRCEKELAIVPGATHLFEERGALEQVGSLAVDWFTRHLAPKRED